MESTADHDRDYRRVGYEDRTAMVAVEEEEDHDNGHCSTPTREEYRIKARSAPPPPPRKKPFEPGKKRDLPKNGYFNPLDLEMFFAMAPTPRPVWKLLHA